MNKKIKFLDILFILFLVSTIIFSISGFLYYQNVVSSFSLPNFNYLSIDDKKTYILDDDNNLIREISLEKNYQVTYEEIPDIFINALLSAEDSTFYEHNGFDIKRIFGAIVSNLSSNKMQGASTLTQQLMKNLLLSNEKSVERKIKELILALKFENKYSKEEILTIYVNEISFDGTQQGANYASLRFFNKKLSDITLPEAALLAGLVKSPTKYNPYNNIEACNERKNVVLSLMKRHGYINDKQYTLASSKHASELLYKGARSQVSYQYQSYLDVVYEEIKLRTGLDPYTTPMIISTHLNTQVQKNIDKIQEGKDDEIKFIDNYQQIGGAILKNDNVSVIGVIGGRNYTGIKLYNRACDMKQQPASTIKPLLSYALAYEYLNWSSAHIVKDVPTNYPYTNISIKNVDNRYLGEITLEDAIGYSRNTSAVATLNEVAKEIGMSEIGKYLDNIHLLDYESYDIPYAYALGGFLNGVTPLYLAGAYAMLANYGIYQEPTTIKEIVLLDSNQKITFNREKKQILSKETGFLITNTLTNVAKKNYWSIGNGAPNNVTIGAKTGTSNFASETLNKLHYPNGVNKDIWYAGYSPDYTMVVWTGFDNFIENEKTYFNNKNDSRVKLPRLIFKKIMSIVAKPNLSFKKVENIVKKTIVKGVYPYKLANENIPNQCKIEAYFKKGFEPNEFYKIEQLPEIMNLDVYLMDGFLEIHFPNVSFENNILDNIIFSPLMVTGKIIYCIDIEFNNHVSTYKSYEPIVNVPLPSETSFIIKGYYQYENIPSFTSTKYNINVNMN